MAHPLRQSELRELGAKTAEDLEVFLPERAEAIERARRGFLKEQPSTDSSRRFRLAALGFALTLLVLGFTLSVSVPEKQQLSFRVGDRTGHASDQIAALQAPVGLVFSDGTQVTLQQRARAHVVSLEEHGAQIALENGTLDANVVHTGVSAWSLSAGPFSIRITGTKFSLSWDPEQQRFSVRVTQGSVAVAGSVIGAERPVRAGETLLVSVPQNRLQLTNDEAPPQLQPTNSAADSNPAPTPASDAGIRSAVGSSEPKERGPSSSAWRALALQGKLREAYASAEAGGFPQACAAANAADLLLLGDAARLSGQPDRVNEALLQLRRRFPRDPRSAAAAFILGKVAFDRGGADRSAASWFATSLREQPKGALAREAAGRLIEALQRAGDTAGAARAAKDYLAWYPDGPHAAVARSLLR